MGRGSNDSPGLGPWLSGKKKMTAAKMPAVMTANTTNMPCQSQCAITKLPTVGANIGEMPMTSMSMENTLALSVGPKKSRTMAREATMPPQLPSACTNRYAMRWSAELVNAQLMDATM